MNRTLLRLSTQAILGRRRGLVIVLIPAALLFDMDGLLVDTEGTWYVVETEVMAELGGPWDENHQLALLGGSLEQSASYMLGLVDRPDVTEDWVARAMVVANSGLAGAVVAGDGVATRAGVSGFVAVGVGASAAGSIVAATLSAI